MVVRRLAGRLAAASTKALCGSSSLSTPLSITSSLLPNRPAANLNILRPVTDGGTQRRYFASLLRNFGTRRGGKLLYIEQNKKIGEFERRNDWRGLLEYAERTKGGYSYVNWATTFSKLGRFRREARDIARDQRFRSLVSVLEGG